MNLWIFNHYADTPDRQATRTYDLSKQLVERGHDVTIFAAGFNHYSFQEERVRPGEACRVEDCNGVRFVWLKTFPYRANDWRRVLNMLGYAWAAWRQAWRGEERPDVIIGVSVHPLAALAAWAVAVGKGSRFFVELTDLWPEVLVDFGLLSRRNPVTWLLRRLEIFLYQRAERILMIWPCTESYVARLGVSPRKVSWIPHGVDLSRYEDLPGYDGAIRRQFQIMYIGSFVNFMAMEVILEAARLLQQRGRGEVRIVLVGGGTEKKRLMRLAEKLGLQNVEFPGVKAKQEICQVAAAADAFVVSLKNVPLLRYGISLNKLCDYFAAGRPVLLAGNPGFDPVQQAGAGLSVPAEDPAALADAIEKLLALEPEERVRMGRNGRAYLRKHHDIRVLAQRLEQILLARETPDKARAGLPAVVKKIGSHPL